MDAMEARFAREKASLDSEKACSSDWTDAAVERGATDTTIEDIIITCPHVRSRMCYDGKRMRFQ